MYCHWVMAQYFLSVLKRKLDPCISFFDPYFLRKDLFSFTKNVGYIRAQNGNGLARQVPCCFK